jgi:hypothetical protein
MAFPNVLRIAKQQYRAAMAAAVTQIPVTEWKDETGQPVVFHVFRLNADDFQAISEARRDYGEQGVIAMTVARSCYLIDGIEKKRAFVDTDLQEILKAVDFDIITRVYLAVNAAL